MNQIPNIEEWNEVTWNVLSSVQTGRMSLADAQERLDTVFHHQLQKAREEERERIRQFLRGLHLLDYYCKCDDVGHVLAMPRKDYDRLISELDQDNK